MSADWVQMARQNPLATWPLLGTQVLDRPVGS